MFKQACMTHEFVYKQLTYKQQHWTTPKNQATQYWILDVAKQHFSDFIQILCRNYEKNAVKLVEI